MTVITRNMKNKIDTENKMKRMEITTYTMSDSPRSSKMHTRTSSSQQKSAAAEVIDLTHSDDDLDSGSQVIDKIPTSTAERKIKKEPLDTNEFIEDTDFETSTVLMRNYLRTYWDTFVPSAKPLFINAWKVSALYVFWIVLHYITAHAYVQYCATPSIYGFLAAPFLISAPHCVAMRWVFSKGGTLIEGMWILLGTWLCSKLVTN